MKKILLNASQKEEVRLAVVENNKLTELDIDFPSRNIKSNIYKGVISRVEPSLEAAFINFGRKRHGFLPFKEISPDLFTGSSKSSRDCLETGKEIIVQVDKEERGNKGAALTTYLSLAGKYLVLLPKNPSTGGISRRIEGDDRVKAKKLMDGLNVPDGMSVILRTSSLESSQESIKWDIDYLIQIYESVLETSVQQDAPFLIYQESSMMARLTRDYCDETVDEVYIDDKEFFDNFIGAKKLFLPHHDLKIEHHSDLTPIFSKHKIEKQVQTVYKRNINLPSGGNIVIDSTEALVSIDVNSARSTKGSDIEETALNTNIEAAVEILTQLKLRDIGGLVVIDFIDMMSINSQKNVMRKVAEYAKKDKAKIQFARISKFGLMELSRQKLKSSIIQNNYENCPTCDGTGQIKSLSSLAISVLRIIEEEAINSKNKETVYLPVRLATYLLNEKKETIKNNIKTTQKAKRHLLNNGLLIIFPSGSVSVAKNTKSVAKDDEWKQFTAKILKQTKSDILPIYFDGKNGLLFHVFASKLKNQTLKYSSYIHETKKMIGKKINIYPGSVIKYSELSKISNREKLTEYLKKKTYELRK